jgi:hypothetical protein
MLGLLFLGRLLLPRPWMATTAAVLLFTLLALGAENPRLEVPQAIVHGVLFALTTAWLGLLPLVVAWLVFHVLIFGTPVAIGVGLWYGPHVLASNALVLLLAGFAFVVALGGRPPLAIRLDD